MSIVIDNQTFEVNPNPCAILNITMSGRSEVREQREIKAIPLSKPQPRGVVAISFKPEDYIAFQMYSIPEQRGVYVSSASDGTYYVTVFVDKRDLALNRRIFERERAIMHFYRQYRFDLSIIPLMNRKPEDVMLPKGKKVL